MKMKSPLQMKQFQIVDEFTEVPEIQLENIIVFRPEVLDKMKIKKEDQVPKVINKRKPLPQALLK